MKLLYVEADDYCANLFRSALPQDMSEEPCQYFVDTAQTPDFALALMRFTSYDAVFVDSKLNYDGDSSSSFLQAVSESGFRNPMVLLTPDVDFAAPDDATLNLIQRNKVMRLPKSDLSESNIRDFIAFVLGRDIRLLHVEDDDEDALLTRELLEEADPIRFDLTRVSTLDEARECIAGNSWDVLLLDWRLDGPGGRETAESLVMELAQTEKDFSVLLLSGQDQSLLPEEVVRLIGRRRICYCAKQEITTARLVNAIMAQRNGLQGTHLAQAR